MHCTYICCSSHHGCLDDLDLSESPYARVQSCTDTYKTGTCDNTDDEEVSCDSRESLTNRYLGK